jgi:putative (di)nucleoside polyphosphate hydrolase
MKLTEITEYRPCVGVMLINDNGQVFVGKRIDTREGDWWQMPQGGVDPGEDLETAVYRELHEETGIEAGHAAIRSKLDTPIRYDLPDELMGKLWGGKYRGQEQIWFLMQFSGADSDVNLNAHDPAEFCEWKWVEPSELVDLIIPFKKPVYQRIVDEFGGLITA